MAYLERECADRCVSHLFFSGFFFLSFLGFYPLFSVLIPRSFNSSFANHDASQEFSLCGGRVLAGVRIGLPVGKRGGCGLTRMLSQVDLGGDTARTRNSVDTAQVQLSGW